MKKWSFLLIVLGNMLLFEACYSQSYVPEGENTKMQIKPSVPIKAFSFHLGDVKLLESPFKEAMRAEAAYLLMLEPDRLLSDFRAHAGLKPKAEKYGGWESSGLAGHSLGHYLSACSMYYAATGDEEYLNRVNYIVSELQEIQKSRKTGYVGAIPNEDEMWAEVASGNIRSKGFDLNGAWAPWYTVHKIMAGLLDAYLYCGNETALNIEKGIADWAIKTLEDLSEPQMQEMMICEYGGMSETLVNTYALTGDQKYLNLSYRFYDKRILDSLAMNIDVLPGKHSNTQIPKIIASARRFELTGDEEDANIANFFWKTVVEDHSYATGGNSNYEYFGEPDKLNDKLSANTTETCNTYNMLKLTRHLFAVQPSSHLMDYYERGLYNHILASQNPKNGMTTYFVSLRQGGHKEYSNPYHSFTCCVGSGMENHVKYGESIYSHGVDGGLYVNLFIPSQLTWKEKGVTVRQETKFPLDGQVDFIITTKRSVSFPIKLRKPVWVVDFTIKINGKVTSVKENDEGYLLVEREWNNNDKIELDLGFDFYTEPMPDNINRKALFYGPVLMSGVFGETEPDPVKGIPVFVTKEDNPNKWVIPVDKSNLHFATSSIGVPEEVKLIPFYQTLDEFYSVYWDVFTPDDWKKQQLVYEEEKRKQQEIEDRTVDIIRLGEMQPERDHEFTGEKTFTGDDHGRKWRSTNDGGYYSFLMKVDSDTKNNLMATYWGMDNRGRVFDILIDGVKIATEDLNKFKKSQFYDISYEIPEELVKGKESVKVTIKAKDGNSAGPVYGFRVFNGDL